MCLIAFAIHASPRWPLVIAANRDEFFNRPTLALARWQTASGQNIISGRDLRAGGTWMGMTPEGRIALLTNVRELPTETPQVALKSRGELVLRWLESDMTPGQFMAQTDCAAYGGFNLVVGDWQASHWSWLSNRRFHPDAEKKAADRPALAGWTSRTLPPGVYGLSNAALDTPWPKTLALRSALSDALSSGLASAEADAMTTPLWTALSQRQRADRNVPHLQPWSSDA